jgi:hypothetical protein
VPVIAVSTQINLERLRRMVGDDATILWRSNRYLIRPVDANAAKWIATTLQMLGHEVLNHERKADE